MTRASRPEGAAESLQNEVRAARAEREEAIAQAERTFWTRIAKLKASYRGAQNDIADILGVTRDAILKGIKKNTDDKPTS
ncbi:hypothetical protein [Streptomyces sp. NPDC004230]